MASYRGVVRNHTIVLEGRPQLPEGAEVEVRLVEGSLSRDEAFARVLANPIRGPVGIDEIIAECKQEHEERPDRWLQ